MLQKKRNALFVSIGIAVAMVFSVAAYDLSANKVTYIIPGAHLDTQWEWTMATTVSSFLPNTFNTNFALFAKYPDYVFNFEGAFRYWLIKVNYPTAYAQLKGYIASNRWFVSGSSVEPGDVNLPAPETLIRNFLYGNGFFRDEFNKTSVDIYLPDCFGFGYALPTIAAHCGIKGFSTQKFDLWGGWFPTPFPIGAWQGVDGSVLVSALKPGPYNDNQFNIKADDGDWLKAHSGTPGIWATYDYMGTGDYGGGPSDGAVQACSARQDANAGNDVKVYMTSSDQLYRDMTQAQIDGLPKFKGELLLKTHGTGCYTAWAPMKLKHRKNEQRANAAENACVMAHWLTQGTFVYPQDTLWRAWFRLLDGTFHDCLTGTSIPTVYSQFEMPGEDSTYGEFSSALSLANAAITPQLATNVSAPGNIPLVLFNQLPTSRTDVVETSVDFGAAGPAAVKVFDSFGKEVPSQVLSVHGNIDSIAFVATVAPVSYSVYEVQPATTPSAPDPNLTVSATGLENQYYKVTIDNNGDISQIVDKKANNQALLSAPSRFEGRSDAGTGFPAWEIQYTDEVAAPVWYADQAVQKTIVENGPARVSLKITRTKSGSTFTQFVQLAAGDAGTRVVVDNTVNWLTTGTLLKVSFPMACANTQATWDLGLGTIQRGIQNENLYEVPGQQWADQTSTDGTYGLSILNDCKYGWNKPSAGTINLSLIHSPAGGGYDYQGDQSSIPLIGLHRFKYSFYGHMGDWTNGTINQAHCLNQPIIAIQVAPHDGTRGKSISLLQVNSPQVDVMAIKMTEADAKNVASTNKHYIVRVRETTGKPVSGASITFGAPILDASELNGFEDPKGAATFANSDLTFDLTAYQPKTFSVQLGVPSGIKQKYSPALGQNSGFRTVSVLAKSLHCAPVSIKVPLSAKIKSVEISDARGRLVRTLAQEEQLSAFGASGVGLSWDGADDNGKKANAGVYLITVSTDNGRISAKMPSLR